MSDIFNTEKPIFVLGLGVAKAGSTWLHRYLNSYDSADFGKIKEYEFFVSYQDQNFYEGIKKRYLNKTTIKFLLTFNAKAIKNKNSYFCYFKSLINKRVRITGDITPRYASLTSDTFAKVKSELEEAGFRVKVILLIRDPVNRIFSEVNMIMNHNPDHFISKDKSLVENVNLFYKTDICKKYSEYEKIIQNVQNVFDKEDFLCLVYENMFSENSISALSKFLNLDPKFERAKVFENKSLGYKTDEDMHLVSKMLKFYKDTYYFCYENFSETLELWRSVDE